MPGRSTKRSDALPAVSRASKLKSRVFSIRRILHFYIRKCNFAENRLLRRIGFPLRGHSRDVGKPEPEQLHLLEIAFVRPVRQEVRLAHERFEVPFTELDQF